MAASFLCPSIASFKSCIQPLFKNSAIRSAWPSPRISTCPQSISREAAMHDDRGNELIAEIRIENISKSSIQQKFDESKDQVLKELDIVFARLKERGANSDADHNKNLSRIEVEVKYMISRLGYVDTLNPSDEGWGSEFSNAPEEMVFKGAVARYYPNPLPDKCPSWLGPAIAAVTLLSLVLALKPGRMPPRIQAGVVSGSHQTIIEVSTKNDGTRNQLLGHYKAEEAPECDLQPILADGSVKLRKAAADAFLNMQDAANHDGIRLLPLSGFRSIERQKNIFFDIKSERNQRAEERAKVSAPPGYSEHHTGYAVDIGDLLAPSSDFEQEFENTDAFSWLQNNASKFHFEMSFPKGNVQGVMYEPWHWRFVGDQDSLENLSEVNQSMYMCRS